MAQNYVILRSERQKGNLMKTLRVGDQVKFLNDTGRGVVTRIVDKETVLVETDDGFEYPVLKEELFVTETEVADKPEPEAEIPVKKEAKAVSPERKKPEEEAPQIADKPVLPAPEGSPLAFAGLIQEEEQFALYLINDSDYYMLYSFSRLKENRTSQLDAGLLEPHTKVWIADVPKKDVLDAKSEIAYHLLPGHPAWHNGYAAVDGRLDLPPDALPLLKLFSENDFFEEEALIKQLFPRPEAERLTTEKLSDLKGAKPKDPRKVVLHNNKQASPALPEIDLHIGQLTGNPENLSPQEILDMQLARFHFSLDGAIRSGEKKMVFIHGLGAGKLKQRIRHSIDTDYPNCSYQDASFKEYGYGATLILIRN